MLEVKAVCKMDRNRSARRGQGPAQVLASARGDPEVIVLGLGSGKEGGCSAIVKQHGNGIQGTWTGRRPDGPPCDPREQPELRLTVLNPRRSSAVRPLQHWQQLGTC